MTVYKSQANRNWLLDINREKSIKNTPIGGKKLSNSVTYLFISYSTSSGVPLKR